MQINNQALTDFANTIFLEECIAFDYEIDIDNEEVVISVVAIIFELVSFEMKKEVSFADFMLSIDEFYSIIK